MASIVTAADGPQHAEWIGEPHAELAAEVCRQLDTALVEWALPDDVVDAATLVVAELLANVVAHARTTFCVTARLVGRVLHIAVDDGCVGVPPVDPDDRPTRGGYGLRIVTAAAPRWGWKVHETGKTVWAQFIV